MVKVAEGSGRAEQHFSAAETAVNFHSPGIQPLRTVSIGCKEALRRRFLAETLISR